MSQLFFAHFKDSWNLGDRVCSPKDVFRDYAACTRIHTGDIDSLPKGSKVIIGGGGLFWPEMVTKFERWVGDHDVAIWGVGLNHALDIDLTPRLYEMFRRCTGPVGVRNVKLANFVGVDWVPCSSVMYPEFDDVCATGSGYGIFYFQHVHRAFAPHGFDRADNGAWGFKAVIERMRAAKAVVTNSFHGAYWAQILHKPVALFEPEKFGNRFKTTFPELVRVSDGWQVAHWVSELNFNWTDYHDLKRYDFRGRHRNANLDFQKKINYWAGL